MTKKDTFASFVVSRKSIYVGINQMFTIQANVLLAVMVSEDR